MATPRKVQLSPEDAGVFSLTKPTAETAQTASLLTLYGLGAPSDVLEKHYQANRTYQMEPKPLREKNVEAMSDLEGFKKFLGKTQYTHDYIEFFTRELEAKGVEAVVQEYLFSRTELADDMLARLYGGFLHPLIHLGFGLEFKQPVIVAEALAETAVHDRWLSPFFIGAEKLAAESKTSKTLSQLVVDVDSDEKLKASAKWADGNKIRDGILKRAPQEMINHAAQYHVPLDQLAQKTAEMMDATVFYTAAAQHPPKAVKIDFFFMHCVNASIFWPTFNALSWISDENKVRLLEWKARLDLVMYVSRGTPPLLEGEIEEYTKETGKDVSWTSLGERLYKVKRDDGHAVKLLRALATAERETRNLEGGKVKRDQWVGIGRMVVDSVEDVQGTEQSAWARSVGFDKAWDDVKERPGKTSL
ncbi:hypothetical protein V495_05163 [Pseudogymnoascus sp. VKM F-4514 (FW-929)]|nr:hypothetical protein V495_05163 [Pseudogymnoascus sp. VKM F-4514 (FW-929)]KFY52246.1 hypothetical protein V497_08581 [Pseudogymnoascus sp. VKM F-4516 (FW-969)]